MGAVPNANWWDTLPNPPDSFEPTSRAHPSRRRINKDFVTRGEANRDFQTGLLERIDPGAADAMAEINDTITKAKELNRGIYFESGATYEGDGSAIDFGGIPHIVAYGAIIQDVQVRFHTDEAYWQGGRVTFPGGGSGNPLVDIAANDVLVRDLYAVPSTTGTDNFVTFRIRSLVTDQQVENISLIGCTSDRSVVNGRAGLEIRDCRGVWVDGFWAWGDTDDGIVVKSIEAMAEDILIENCWVKDHATVVGIGDDCGKGIRNVTWRDCVGVNSRISIRAGKDTRPGGDVEHIRVSNVHIVSDDENLNRNLVIALADGDGRIDDLVFEDVWMSGRFKTGISTQFPWSVRAETGSRGIGRVHIIGGGYVDPFDGAPEDVATPGQPATRNEVRCAGDQDIDEVVFRDWYTNAIRGQVVWGRADSTGQVKLLRVLRPIVEQARIVSGGNDSWVQHDGGGELEVVSPVFGPTAPTTIETAIAVTGGTVLRDVIDYAGRKHLRSDEPFVLTLENTAGGPTVNHDIQTTGIYNIRFGNTILFAIRDGRRVGVGAPHSGSAFNIEPAVASNIVLRLKAAASQTADILQALDSGNNVLSRINKGGYFMTRRNAAPADADLVAGEVAMWFDSTDLAAAVNFKGKTADGTVVTGSVGLS